MKMIVTNLRMEENDYLQAKEMAAEMGMSLNEYFNHLSADSARRVVFSGGKQKRTMKRKNFLEALGELANKKYTGKGMGLSKDDEVIYED